MKHHIHVRLLLASLAIALVSFVFATSSANAHALVAHPQASSTYCAVKMVYLHGKSAPTTKCLRQQQNNGQVTPLTFGTDCAPSTLYLEGADNIGPLSLCFLGTGFINMTDYIWRIWPDTWNDAAFLYRSGCNSGTFFADIQGQGARQNFGPGEAQNFDGRNGRLNDLTLSSFQINSSC